MLTVTGKQFVTSRRGELRSSHGTSDAALIRAIAANDRDAMHVLYVRHSVRVYRFVLRLTNDSSLAEDLVSEVFVDVWRGARGFKEKSQVSTWLLAIARNKTFAAMRARLDEQLDDEMAKAICRPRRRCGNDRKQAESKRHR
jgi:RNA polymerase sigma-70 factor (ECF subfamily)